MPVETVTYISDLNASMPQANDPISAGDDHIRNTKKALKNTFPNINNAVTVSHTQLNLIPANQTELARLETDKADKAVVFTAGAGLSGGGSLTANRTFNVGAANGIVVSPDAISVANGSGIIVTATGVHVNSGPGLSQSNTHVYVGTGDGIWADAASIHVDANNGLVANSSGLFVRAGDGIVSNSTGVHVNNATVVRAVDTKAVQTGTLITTASNTNIIHYFRDLDSGLNRGAVYYNTNDDSFRIQKYFRANTATESFLSITSTAISSNRTFTGDGSGLTNLDASSVTTGVIPDARLPTNIVRNTIQIVAGSGLTGGGNLAANRTIAIGQGNGIVVGSTAISVKPGNAIGVDGNGVHVVPGNGLEINEAGTAIRINTDTVVTTGGNQTINGVKTFTGVISAPGFNATSAAQGFWGVAADSAVNPSFSWTGSGNTGMWKTGGGIGFTVDGVNRAQILTTGFVGSGAGITNLTAANLTGNIAQARLADAMNATGSAPMYAVRAWGNGLAAGGLTGASGNIASITRISTGIYQINFSTAMPNLAYVVQGNCWSTTASNEASRSLNLIEGSRTASNCRIATRYSTSGSQGTADLDFSFTVVC